MNQDTCIYKPDFIQSKGEIDQYEKQWLFAFPLFLNQFHALTFISSKIFTASKASPLKITSFLESQIDHVVENHKINHLCFKVFPLTIPLCCRKWSFPSLGIASAKPTQLYTAFHSCTDLTHPKLRWSNVSTSLLHRTHLATSMSTMTFLFQRFLITYCKTVLQKVLSSGLGFGLVFLFISTRALQDGYKVETQI